MIFSVVCKAKGGAQVAIGSDSESWWRLAAESAFWSLEWMMGRGSLVGVEKEMHVGVDVEVWEDEDRARLLVALDGVAMLRCDACEEVLSMSSVLVQWQEMINIESLAVVESSLWAGLVG